MLGTHSQVRQRLRAKFKVRMYRAFPQVHRKGFVNIISIVQRTVALGEGDGELNFRKTECDCGRRNLDINSAPYGSV